MKIQVKPWLLWASNALPVYRRRWVELTGLPVKGASSAGKPFT